MTIKKKLKCLKAVIAEHFGINEKDFFTKSRRREEHHIMAVLIFSYYANIKLAIPLALISKFSDKSKNAVWKNVEKVKGFVSVADKEYIQNMVDIEITFTTLSRWDKLRIYFKAY